MASAPTRLMMRRAMVTNQPDPRDLRETVERFLAGCRRPALIEPGEPILLLEPDHYLLEERPTHLSVQAWDDRRNLVRKVRSVDRAEKGKLRLVVQRFGGREGALHLVDLAHPRTQDWERKGSRLIFRERFRRMLGREFASWGVAELSSEADLEHSLSPAYPRALLRRGNRAMAAIAAPPECGDFPAMLTFGLIWLDYVRARNPKRTVEALLFWAPSPVAPMLSFYLPLLNPAWARFAMFLYSEEDFARELDPRNYGNVATQLEPCRRALEAPFAIEHAASVPLADGSASLRVAGLEFARYREGRLANGREAMSVEDARVIAANLHAIRSAGAPHGTLLFHQNPEAWLESVVRSRLDLVDASLVAAPIYGQVPAIAGQNRTVLDLLAVDHHGRLAVLELKAAQDLHLPLQALDYWLRVKWHLDRGEFSRFGYFPGIDLCREPPRLLLVAPSLEFHPSTETILRYLVPEIDVARIGLSADWRENPRVMFRLTGAQQPY